MLPQEKVSQLNDYAVYEDIIAFFDEFDQKNNDKRKDRNGKPTKSATRISYEKNVREFFSILLNKEIEHLTEEDLKNIKKRDVISYRKHLQDNGNSNSTVNQKMASVKSLAKFLNAEHDINVAAFELKRLDSIPINYGKMTKEEAELFAETAFNTEREKNYQKKYLILTAIRTSFRLDELLNLKWSNFEEIDGVFKVSIQGKRGKIVTNSVSAKFFNELVKLKEINLETKWNGDPELIFQLSEGSVNSMMSRIRERLSINPERNLTFHSFRNVGISWEYEQTLDIKKAAQQANHSNIDTTFKHYIDQKRDYTQSAGVRMDETFEIESELESATLDHLKEFIRNGDYKLHLEFKRYMERLTGK